MCVCVQNRRCTWSFNRDTVGKHLKWRSTPDKESTSSREHPDRKYLKWKAPGDRKRTSSVEHPEIKRHPEFKHLETETLEGLSTLIAEHPMQEHLKYAE